MADETSTPKHLTEAIELGQILRPSWAPMSHELRLSGVPLNEGEAGGEGGGGGGEGGGEGGSGDGGENGGEGGSGGDEGAAITPEEQAIIDKAENPDAVRSLITTEREARKAAESKATAEAAKVKTFEDRDKTDQEKAEQKAADAEKKAADAEGKLLRLTVASEKKLPAELVEFLKGETKEELEASADKLLKFKGSSTEEAPADLDGGARKPAPADVSPGLGRLAHAYEQSGKK